MKTHTATTAKRETPASTQVVDIFDDPLNASDVWHGVKITLQAAYVLVFLCSFPNIVATEVHNYYRVFL